MFGTLKTCRHSSGPVGNEVGYDDGRLIAVGAPSSIFSVAHLCVRVYWQRAAHGISKVESRARELKASPDWEGVSNDDFWESTPLTCPKARTINMLQVRGVFSPHVFLGKALRPNITSLSNHHVASRYSLR